MRTLMHELRDEIAALKADNQKLKDDLKTSRGNHAWATRKARDAENAAGVLKEENARLRGSGERTAAIPEPHTPTAEPEPDVFLAPPFLELVRVHRYLAALYATENEEDCRMANQSLEYVAGLVAAIEAERPALKDRRRTA